MNQIRRILMPTKIYISVVPQRQLNHLFQACSDFDSYFEEMRTLVSNFFLEVVVIRVETYRTKFARDIMNFLTL